MLRGKDKLSYPFNQANSIPFRLSSTRALIELLKQELKHDPVDDIPKLALLSLAPIIGAVVVVVGIPVV